jgi:serine/threonine protein kinase
MDEVKKILPIVKTIPNYQKYFLLDNIFSCDKFGPLSNEDKKNFSKCNNLIRNGFTTRNINLRHNLQKLGTIYIPDGGKSVSSIMEKLGKNLLDLDDAGVTNFKKFGIVSWGLINVIKKAIVPMNEKGLVHLDLKGDNLLVNPQTLKDIKIIDWGLAGVIDNNKNNVIEEIKNRPIQFNAPFSNILFSEELPDILDEVKTKLMSGDAARIPAKDIPYRALPIIAADIIDKLILSNGSGHIDYLRGVFKKSAEKLNYLDGEDIHYRFRVEDYCFQYNTLFYNYLIKYISNILEKYLYISEKGNFRFHDDLYFQEVYRYNCDIWGLLTVYQDFNDSLNSVNSLYIKISNILYKYLYSGKYAAERIPVNELVKDLEDISINSMAKPASNVSSNKETILLRSPEKSEPLTKTRSSTKKVPVKTKTVKKKKLKLKGKPASIGIKNSALQEIEKTSKTYIGKLIGTRKRCPRGWKAQANKENGIICVKQ